MDEGQLEAMRARHTVRRVLYVAAVISTVCGVLYFLGLAGKWIVDGTIHSASSQPVQIVSAAIGLLWDATLVVMFLALARQVARRSAVFAELGVVFMAMLCATSSINWFVQLTLVPQVARAGDAAVLALVDVRGATSITYAIEHLAWGLFYGLATIFMALALGSGKLEAWVRWLFIVSGGLSIVHVFGIAAGAQSITDLGYFAAAVPLPIATALLAARFRGKDDDR